MRHYSVFGILFAMVLANCSGGGQSTGAITRVPLTVAGVTYQWPYDATAGAGDPKGWNKLHVAYFPKSFWNETVGSVPSMRFPQNSGYYAVDLRPAKKPHWNIGSDGAGLPNKIRLSAPKSAGNVILGEDDRPENTNPPTIVVFKSDPEAYAACHGPEGPYPICILYLNDRGVVHTLTMPWGKWDEAGIALKLYRAAVGAPDPTV
ncbi:hypothetical protein [uncultured Novosphingobium sp.]|uniref:hypothetical protein n=1 Tax=uncultured Novosphingobium sp. TaxID=292277 RepID=UPI0025828098|nr:hypothetical protein [uncultured Novosphingobium sp.]